MLISISTGNLPFNEPMYLDRRAFFKVVMAGDMIFLPFRLLRMDKMPAMAK